jgi:hypothetical protein
MTMTYRQFRCGLRTKASLRRDPDVFARMWSLLASPEVGAVTYDHSETQHRHRFTTDPAGALELFEDYGWCAVLGERDGFYFEATHGDNDIYRTSLYLNEAAVDRWSPWILRLIDELPVLFGGGYSLTEYDAKHVFVEEHSGGGRSEGALGVSNAEFQKYLPGVYWLTVFGPDLAGALDFSGLSQLPVTVTTLARGARTVQIDEPLVPADMSKRLQLEARIADVLGAHYFFDRNRSDIEFAHPAAFKAVLDQLAGRE